MLLVTRALPVGGGGPVGIVVGSLWRRNASIGPKLSVVFGRDQRRWKLTISDVRGPTEPAVSKHTHGSFLDELVDKYGSLPMLKSVHQNRELTYSEFRDMALLVARNLSKFGISKGDTIGVCAGTLWEYAVLQFALGAMGAVLVPLNPAFTVPQFLQALSKSGAKSLIIQSQLARGRKEPRDTAPIVEQLTNELKEMKNVFMIPPGGVSGQDTSPPVKPTEGSECKVHPARVLFEGSIEAGARCTNEFSTAPDETINMQFTSGTTSMPKISCLSHRNLINNGIYIGNRMGLSATKSTHPTGQDHVCVPVPLFHCFGLVLSNLATMATGGCLVYPSESFDATAVLQSVRLHKCTALHGVPTMFAAELDLDDEIAKGGLSTLRTGIAAGSSVPIEIMKRLESTFGLDKLTICYGMTETSPVSFMTFPHDSVEYRTSSVGSVMPNTYARIVDPTDPTLTPLPTGKNGEIVVAGYLVQSGYFRDPEKTAEAIITDSDGLRWMRTGDEGVMDENGYLVVSGRIKDLIIRGGENIHPLDVENVLFQHPKVSQACVVGVPDKKYGEAVGAFVIVEHRHRDDPPSIEELQELVDSHLGHYMVPKYVYFVDDYPKTTSGKIRKVDLRKVAAELAANGRGLSRRDAARHATAVAASGA